MTTQIQNMILIAALQVLENVEPCVIFEFADSVNGLALQACDEIEDAEDIDEAEGVDE